jgi:hypothetical protein
MTYFRARIVLLIAVTAAANAQAQSIGFSISNNSSNPSTDLLQVQVMDDDTLSPLTDAQVSVSDSIGISSVEIGSGGLKPDDTMTSDSTGNTFFRGLSASPKTVTISKTGYATLSVIGVEGVSMTAFLRPVLAQPKTIVVSGTVNGWHGTSTDPSYGHAALVFRTQSAIDLLDFQIANFISPLKDSIDLGIAGKHNIASNIAVPQQTVNYFVDIDLNKPVFRLPLPASQSLGLTAVEVEGLVSDVVSVLQSHKFTYDVLNRVKFLHVGSTADFSSGSDTQVNIDANAPLVPQHQVSISATPPFDADVVAAALTDTAGDKSVLIPSDLKTILSLRSKADPQTVSLLAPQGAAGESLSVATIAIGSGGTQISGVLVSQAGSTVQTGDFLNTAALAQGQAIPANVQMTAPSQGLGAAIFETDQPVWYVFTLPVAGTVSIPTEQIASAATLSKYSVSQVEFSQFDPSSLDGSRVMSKLQRFARSSAKLAQ